MEFDIKLGPRESCAFTIFSFSAKLTMKHQYPITVYYSDDVKEGTNMTHFNATNMVWSGKRETPNDCLYKPCTYNYDLESTNHNYYLVNWDRHKNQTLTLRIAETNSIKLFVSLFSVHLAIFSVYV